MTEIAHKVDRMSNNEPHTRSSHGYPIFYTIGSHDEICCPQCAAEAEDADPETRLQIKVNWENPGLHCERCNCRIESAYA